MTYMRPCRRCGVEYDFDLDRTMNGPHAHGPEPRGWSPGGMTVAREGTAPGTRVRLIHPRDGLTVGQVFTVQSTSPEHHSQNGGGYTIYTTDGQHLWSVWLEVVG